MWHQSDLKLHTAQKTAVKESKENTSGLHFPIN